MPERRITCPRHHLLFQLVADGIAIKCRGGECRQVYVVTWAELDAKRQEVTQASALYALPPTAIGEGLQA